MKPLHIPRTIFSKQRGAAMMVMLVIMVVGIAAFLVSSLNSSSLKSARDQRTADALAQAKDALIGSAATENNIPGSLPCPDINDDGSSEGIGNCTSYIGRLPWRTLGLPDLRDGSGEHLWYALSTNFRNVSSSTHVNSETNGLLNVTSAGQVVNNVIAVVFSPGNALTGQDRSSTATTSSCTIGGVTGQFNSFCVQNYLEGSNAASPTAFQSSASGIAFNDQLITITREQLFPSVEMRIAREAKKCLDDYASVNISLYPWAADPSDAYYSTKPNTWFGRLPKRKYIDANVQNLFSTINALQTEVTSCANGVGNQATLQSAGNALEIAADYVKDNPTSPTIPPAVTTPAIAAGDKAKDADVTCADIQSNPTGNTIQTNLNSAVSALDAATALPWPASCTLFASNYWPDWSNQIFYQVDNNYRPGASGPPAAQSISINSTGTYRAVVIMARSPILGQIRVPSDSSKYLEAGNLHTNPAPSTMFLSNALSSPSFKTVNDLVICLDGKENCL
jgi:hypothetical protein